MISPTIVTRLVSELKRFSNEFCDLVLGPEPIEQPKQGVQIVEMVVREPEQIAHYLNELISEPSQTVAIVGADAGYCEGKRAESVFVIQVDSAAKQLRAAFELLKSNAFHVVVVQELLLNPDFTPELLNSLHQIKAELTSSETSLVLLNPLTAERKRILSELEILCSHQIFYKD